jgi:hypothetical protein
MVVGNVQTGPAPINDPEHLGVGAPPSADVGAISAGGAAADAGDKYACSYTERQLPAGVPVVFRGGARPDSPTQRGHVVYAVSLKPDGWSGTEVVTGFAQGKNFMASVGAQLTGFGEKAAVAVKRDPGDPASRYATRVDPVVNQAVTATAAQTNVRANPAQRVALNPQPLPPKSADALTQSGNALFARGDFSGAAAAFQRAIDANATNAVALHNLAIAHARLGQTDRATAELRRASDLARRQGDLTTARAADSAVIQVTAH